MELFAVVVSLESPLCADNTSSVLIAFHEFTLASVSNRLDII